MESINQHELKSLDKIFKPKTCIFQIPDYQRGYSWEERQRTDLLNYIESVIKREHEFRHYTGTIVVSLNEKNDQYEIFDIVDGQQRLTSLILVTVCNMQICKRTLRYAEHMAKGFL